jgi:hypothetical protein
MTGGKKHLTFAVLGALVLAFVATALPSRRHKDFSGVNRMLEVEVDVYSGRPNPRWELSSQQAEELLKKLRSLPARESAASLSDGLGYRGLIVSGDELMQAGDTEIVISNGIVEARAASGARQFTDKDRAVERWLLQTGKGKLEDDLYEYLSQETSK